MTHQHSTAMENIVGNGEIARDEQFLLFPQCFQLKQIIVSPFVRIFDIISLFSAGISGKGLTHSHTMTPFDTPGKQAF